MPDRTHFMYCTNEQEKQDWLNIIKWKLSCLERYRVYLAYCTLLNLYLAIQYLSHKIFIENPKHAVAF